MADLEGFDELMKALDETSLNLTQKKNLIVKSLREGPKPLEERIRSDMPVLTGAAKESVSTSVVDQTAIGAEAHVGPKRFYPKFAEYGTIHQPAKPVLGPAFDNTEEQVVEIISKVLGDGIEESYNRG